MITASEKLEYKFIQLTTEEFLYLIQSGLTKNGILLFLRLKFNDPFGDRYRSLPEFDQLAQELNVSESTIRRELNKIIDLGLIIVDYCNRFVSACKNLKVAAERVRTKIFCPEQNCENNVNSDRQNAELQNNSQLCEIEQLELLPDIASSSLQTEQTDPTSQTGEEDTKTKEESSQAIAPQQSSPTKTFACIPSHQPKKNTSADELHMKHKIPEELAERLSMCNIPLSEQVLVKILQHHISQAYGAITHIENTWETIKDPRAIFLYQLPLQPIEQLGQRYSDRLLEKQKSEQKMIDDEIARGRPSITSIPKFQALKEKLAKKIGTQQVD